MSRLFEDDYPGADQGYVNLKSQEYEAEREMHGALQALWERYEPFAENDFRRQFAAEPQARFWEMFLACALLDAGHRLVPFGDRRGGGQPDICIVEGDRRIWIEAIAPKPGNGRDAIRLAQNRPADDEPRVKTFAAPEREVALRIVGALKTKTDKVREYRQKNVIAEDEPCLVAIGGAEFGIYAQERPLPAMPSAILPIGPLAATIDRESGEVVAVGYRRSDTIDRTGADPIPRTALLDDYFVGISAVIWSRVTIGNMSRAERPMSVVHNPRSTVRIAEGWVNLDREFTVRTNDQDIDVHEVEARDPA